MSEWFYIKQWQRNREEEAKEEKSKRLNKKTTQPSNKRQ